MFQKLKVPIIGIVENMSSVKCPNCSSNIQLFGKDVSALAKEIGTIVLQQMPLQQEITSGSDKGVPIVIARPDCEETIAFRNFGKKVIEFIENSEKG